MSEHTKEPWRLGKWFQNGRIVETAGDTDICADTEDGIYVLGGMNTNFMDDAKANARRIVACVNACAGISNDALDAGAIQDRIESVAGELYSVKRQRDALEIIAVCTAGALEKAGFTEIDNPADAIEVLAKQRDELFAALQKVINADGVVAYGAALHDARAVISKIVT